MKTLIFLLTLLTVQNLSASQVKVMKLRPQDVGVINTAVGYSTVIQLPVKPSNVVLGDQSAFRVEFINDSITIKPLRHGAKSNVFIFTENDRFNLTVKSGASAGVDYVVRLMRVFEDEKRIRELNRTAYFHGFTLKLLKETLTAPSRFFDFELIGTQKRSVRLNPELFRITEGHNVIAVKSLYLESDHVEANHPVHGSLSVDESASKSISTIWVGVDGKPLKFSFVTNAKAEVLHAAK